MCVCIVSPKPGIHPVVTRQQLHDLPGLIRTCTPDLTCREVSPRVFREQCAELESAAVVLDAELSPLALSNPATFGLINGQWRRVAAGIAQIRQTLSVVLCGDGK